MLKPLLIDRRALAVLDPKTRRPVGADRTTRALNRMNLKGRVLAAVRPVLRGVPESRSIRVTRNPLPPFGG